jgi:hypothetical protein
MPYRLNNHTSKTLDYFTPLIVFNRIKPKKNYQHLIFLTCKENLNIGLSVKKSKNIRLPSDFAKHSQRLLL